MACSCFSADFMSALMCCLFRCWSTRTPWIPAVPGPLTCSADGVVYQRSSTIGADAARCAPLLARGAVMFWWSTSASVKFRLEQLEITRKQQFLKTCHDRSSHPCREKMRQNLEAAPHGVAGVAILESPFPRQIHCEDIGVARMRGRLRLCRYKTTMNLAEWW